jgi:MFS family permease
MGGAMIGAAGLLVLSVSSDYAIGLAAIFVMGFGYVHANTSMTAAVQVQVAERFRGRVVSIFLMANIGGTALGAFVLGQLAAHVNLRATLGVAAGVLVAYFTLAWLRFDRLHPLDEELADV